ncbi:Exocyst complex component S5 [Gnomoniopsis smithogilvyi]|uniref:Exocyst complex component SEC5 n=1 Tax=Gnomoniopsis smithogilvyi TaxID=1191159 RepID=A0A9W8YR02_9PEZI|nr:Exocyst complex component S5 [Gnomoniopsis smithogilvyi]
MADFERNVLDFYQLSNPYPVEWPTEKDNSDVSEDEDMKSKANRRKSRYQALEKAVSNRNSMLPGHQKSSNGVGNIVQKDEPDPLGTTDSVVRTLKQLGVPVQEDPRLRQRFLMSSTTFSPALFLSQLHATADTQSLLNGLDILSQSIDQKSASLKVLVESNFERFVRAKATIDNVYKEMKYRGVDPNPPSARARAHSRHASRSSFRNSSGMALPSPMAPDPRKKNALIKESEYGVSGIKGPLLEVSAKAEEVWGPALGGRDKEENLKVVAATLEKHQEYVETSSAIAESIKRKDYEALIEEYNKARIFADEARRLAQTGSEKLPDDQLYRILLAARMWHDVHEQIEAFKRDMWKKLINLHTAPKSETNSRQDQHIEIISLLLELGVDENPIWIWLLSRYDYLKAKVAATADRTKVEIEVARRRIANSDKPGPQTIANHLKSIARQSIESRSHSFDSADIVELWEKIVTFMTNMLSSQGIVGELVEFWQTVQGFLEGRTQKSLPTGYNGESLKHHDLSAQGVTDLEKGTVELVDIIREHVFLFFSGPPPDDLSMLVSPMPTTPSTPLTASLGGGGALTPNTLRIPRMDFDPTSIPPPSPKRGEAWEKFAFWPPWSNSVSGAHYLSKALALVGSGACDMASLAPVARGDGVVAERLRALVGSARDRCVTAVCAAWNKDAENIKYVEDWSRSPERKDVTKMPASFKAFESALLTGMQQILYISDAMSKPGAGDIVQAPPSKLQQTVRSQYVTTLYKALSGMVENAERSTKKSDDEWTTEEGFVVINGGSSRVSSFGGASTINATDRNVRMLLTLSNLQSLRAEVVPGLNSQFENAFSVQLTDEEKKIRDVLGQIDARLFQSYTRPYIESLRTCIRQGITAADWAPAGANDKPREVRPYVYEVLLNLVLVHSQVSTTAATLTSQVLSYLLEQASKELLEAFKMRPKYNLSALMQATIDVEFVAQTLTQYMTERSSETQTLIYQELDTRTDNDARAKLQSELSEMRSVLKKLREASKSEFACFKKPRRREAMPGGASSRADNSSISTASMAGSF